MIRYIYADQFSEHAALKASMFRDRAKQFRNRLKWEVTVDADGWEIDQYDYLNPLYVLSQNPDGSHDGSIRILPTVGRTMAAEHFSHLTDGVRIASPLIWECTRFCLSPGAPACVAPMIALAGIELGLRFGIEQAVGVVYARSLPLYRRIGWIPDIVGRDGKGYEEICICLWNITEEGLIAVARRVGISRTTVAGWLDRDFNRARVQGDKQLPWTKQRAFGRPTLKATQDGLSPSIYGEVRVASYLNS